MNSLRLQCAFCSSEFLDKVQSELDSTNGRSVAPSVSSSQQQLRDVITSLFQGELVSELKCLRCGYTSHSYEPFMDLSLEFPDQFQPQQRAAPNGRAASESCCIEGQSLPCTTQP